MPEITEFNKLMKQVAPHTIMNLVSKIVFDRKLNLFKVYIFEEFTNDFLDICKNKTSDLLNFFATAKGIVALDFHYHVVITVPITTHKSDDRTRQIFVEMTVVDPDE